MRVCVHACVCVCIHVCVVLDKAYLIVQFSIRQNVLSIVQFSNICFIILPYLSYQPLCTYAMTWLLSQYIKCNGIAKKLSALEQLKTQIAEVPTTKEALLTYITCLK